MKPAPTHDGSACEPSRVLVNGTAHEGYTHATAHERSLSPHSLDRRPPHPRADRLNGVLAMSELAIVSSREARLKAMAKSGSGGAQVRARPRGRPGPIPVDRAERDHADRHLRRRFFRARASASRPPSGSQLLGLEPETAHTVGFGMVIVLTTYRLAGHRRDRPEAVRASLAGADRGRHGAADALAVESHRAVRLAARPVERADLQAARARPRIARTRSRRRSFIWSSPKRRPPASSRKTSAR